jgi:hypothetical protein
MATINPIQIHQYLEGASYPAQKSDLIFHANNQKADEGLLDLLERLPEKKYNDLTEVINTIGDLGKP